MLCALMVAFTCACAGGESQEPVSSEAVDAPVNISTTTTTTTVATSIGTTTTISTTTTPVAVPAATTKKSTTTTTIKTTPTTKVTSLPFWKQIYITTAKLKADEYDSFALVDLDGDDIPEMFMRSKNGHVMSAWRKMIGTENYSIISQPLNKDNGAQYIPKSGRFMNAYVDGDHITMKIYELNDTRFVELFTGYEYTYESGEKVYYFAGQDDPVSPAEFSAKAESLFKLSHAISLATPALSLEEFQDQVKKWE